MTFDDDNTQKQNECTYDVKRILIYNSFRQTLDFQNKGFKRVHTC